MDWKKQTEKLIKVLNDAQRKMWDLCADSIKTIAAAPMDKKWVHSVEATEKVIANSLRTQAKLSAAIVDRLAEVDNMPKTTLESTRSIQEIIENLVVTQEKLLETWFDVLKKMDPAGQTGRLTDPLQRMQDLAAKAMDTQMDLLRGWTGKPAPKKRSSAKKSGKKKKTPTRQKSTSKKKASTKKTAKKKTAKKKTARKKASR